MVTNYPQQLAATENAHVDTTTGVMSRVASRLSQTLCGLGGHDAVMHFQGNRVMMRCTSCGHDTPGWEVSGRRPRLRFEGDANRHRMANQARSAQSNELRRTA
jgi:NAD-dependent SIR2 family protein deacetylase